MPIKFIFIVIIAVLALAIYTVSFGQTLTTVNIRGKVFTPKEYTTFKANITKKIVDKKVKPTHDDVLDWLDVANKELKIKPCSIQGVTDENIVEKINFCIK